MIDSKSLLADLKKQLKVLTTDLRERAEDPQDAWGIRPVDQAAVAWLGSTPLGERPAPGRGTRSPPQRPMG